MSTHSPPIDDPLHADRTLVAAIARGKQGAFAQLVQQYQRLCWHIIDRLVRHPEDTRELCQEVFLRVHQCLHQYRGESALKSWIAQIAYSIAKRHLERKRIPLAEQLNTDSAEPTQTAPSNALDLATHINDQQMQKALYRAIDALAPLPRTVLMLYHIDELSITEIAAITSLAEGTIKSHLHRSRAQLRSILQGRLGESL
jgi:RNA polymerase sigma factor (sigma-70 family)